MSQGPEPDPFVVTHTWVDLPDGRRVRFGASRYYDADVFERLDGGGEAAVLEYLATACACGHPRADHYAATGSLGSFGASACGLCWACATFRAVPA